MDTRGFFGFSDNGRRVQLRLLDMINHKFLFTINIKQVNKAPRTSKVSNPRSPCLKEHHSSSCSDETPVPENSLVPTQHRSHDHQTPKTPQCARSCSLSSIVLPHSPAILGANGWTWQRGWCRPSAPSSTAQSRIAAAMPTPTMTARHVPNRF